MLALAQSRTLGMPRVPWVCCVYLGYAARTLGMLRVPWACRAYLGYAALLKHLVKDASELLPHAAQKLRVLPDHLHQLLLPRGAQ